MAEKTFEERTDNSFEKLFNILEGKNGGEGLILKVDRNTQFRKRVQKNIFVMYASIIGLFFKEFLWSKLGGN